jgi:hypothetical protein
MLLTLDSRLHANGTGIAVSSVNKVTVGVYRDPPVGDKGIGFRQNAATALKRFSHLQSDAETRPDRSAPLDSHE